MKRVWDEKKDNLVRRHYAKGDLLALADRLGVTKSALKTHARKLGLRRKVNLREEWTPRQLAYLREHYADMPGWKISEKVHHPLASVHRKAWRLGLEKSREFLAQNGRAVSCTEGSRRSRFQKGHTPANKGKRMEDLMSAESYEKVKKNWFKKGGLPPRTMAVGTERLRADGYVYLRRERGWVPKHRHVWEQANGKIPKGYVVAFRDGDRRNCDIENLCLMSCADNARRRALSETPEARQARVAKAQVTRNKNIRRDRLRIHWGMEPIGKLVKRW